MITHRERMQACLSGEMVDRPPVALWRHFPVDDQAADTLASAHLAFQAAYDFDLLKLTPASSFSVRDWGVEDVWEGSPEGTRTYSRYVVTKPSDWERLRVLDASAPYLSAQIDCLRRTRQDVGADTPLLQTVFSSLAQAKHLAGDRVLLDHSRRFPEAVMRGLETITESTRRFIHAVAETGADGIFFAIQHARTSLLSRDEFVFLSRASDLELLQAADGLWCNMLHLHGENVYFDAVVDYPAHILNWHDREAGPALSEARRIWRGVVCGGISRQTLVYQLPAAIEAEAREAIESTGGRKLLLGTGCVAPIITPMGNMAAARRSVEAAKLGRGAG